MLTSFFTFVIANKLWFAGGAAIGLVLNFLLKRYMTQDAYDKIYGVIHKFGYGIGKTVTLGLSSWKWTKAIWNSVLEPYVLILLRTVVQGLLNGMIAGLQSDNESFQGQK